MTTPFTMTPDYSLQQSSSNSINLPQTPTSLNNSVIMATNSTPNDYPAYKNSNFSFDSPNLNTKVQSSMPSNQQHQIANTKLNLEDYNSYDYSNSQNNWKQQQQQTNSTHFYLY